WPECFLELNLPGGGDSTRAEGLGQIRPPRRLMARSGGVLCLCHQETTSLTIAAQAPFQRAMMNWGCEDEKLGGAAREAKDRLDEKLRTRGIKSDCRRSNAGGRRSGEQEGDTQLRREVVSGSGLKKGGPKRFSWGKLSWKAADQEECAVCLDSFRAGETLTHLPCAHRFHSRCLVPWLESHSHCPCCRMAVSSS
ncbi:RING-type domain-containing protein, partial [Psidium guajava]